MTTISSVASTWQTCWRGRPPGQTNRHRGHDEFQATLTKVQNTIAGKPSTGFTGGATFNANSWTAQTKAALDSALSSTKSALTIKPKTGFNQ